jgi:hypothetical protein
MQWEIVTLALDGGEADGRCGHCAEEKPAENVTITQCRIIIKRHNYSVREAGSYCSKRCGAAAKR